MDSTQLNQELLEAFPELTPEFQEYTSWQDGIETGSFLTYEDLFLPLVKKALETQDETMLVRAGIFIERLMTLDDDYAKNVATVGVIEGLRANKDDSIRRFLGESSLIEYDSMDY